jgi:hypothetical protein
MDLAIGIAEPQEFAQEFADIYKDVHDKAVTSEYPTAVLTSEPDRYPPGSMDVVEYSDISTNMDMANADALFLSGDPLELTSATTLGKVSSKTVIDQRAAESYWTQERVETVFGDLPIETIDEFLEYQ